MNKFFDGLADNTARQHVEFVKAPKNIDVAVQEVNLYQDLKKRPTKSKLDSQDRVGRTDCPCSESETEGAAPPVSAKKSPNGRSKKRARKAKAKVRRAAGQPTHHRADSNTDVELKTLVRQMASRIAELEQAKTSQPHLNQQPRDISTVLCYRCQQYGHYANTCQGAPRPQQAAQANPRPANPHQVATSMARAAARGQCFKCGQVGHFASSCQTTQFAPRAPAPTPRPSLNDAGLRQ